jgi:hypothetical protein
MSIKAAIEEFTHRLSTILEAQAMDRAKAAVLDAFGVEAPKRRGRPPKTATPTLAAAPKMRKKMPPQFCPVPGCKNKAAPVFGMVCAKHKDVAKSLIKKYREARRAKKLGAGPAEKKVARARKAAAPAKPTTRRASSPSEKVPKRAAKPAARPQPQNVSAPRPAPAAAPDATPPA